jgi:hypothetical protein
MEIRKNVIPMNQKVWVLAMLKASETVRDALGAWVFDWSDAK